MSELLNKTYLVDLGQKAKEASYELGAASTKEKDEALNLMAEELINAKKDIIAANKIDLDIAESKGTSKAMLDRLALSDDRIEGMAAAASICCHQTCAALSVHHHHSS